MSAYVPPVPRHEPPTLRQLFGRLGLLAVALLILGLVTDCATGRGYIQPSKTACVRGCEIDLTFAPKLPMNAAPARVVWDCPDQRSAHGSPRPYLRLRA